MMIIKKNLNYLIPLVLLLFFASSAHAGWYEVKNYAGTIGGLPVHVSLQTFDALSHGEPGQWLVEGSYYYDSRRIPIPLQGKRQPDGSMQLCEAAPPLSIAELPVVPAASPKHPVPCQITLSFADDNVTGKWNDGKKELLIALLQVGSLNDTSTVRLDGDVEIPMWFHTKTHLLLGVYTSSADCPASMRHLRLINIATGRVDRDIPLECDAGMIITSIYANVSSGPTRLKVIVGFQRGRMGTDKVVDIRIRAARGK